MFPNLFFTAFFGLLTLSSFAMLELTACSRVFWSTKLNKVVARTMDLFHEESPTLTFLPRGILRDGHVSENSLKWTSKYGSVVVTAFDNESVSEGMNEMGLCAHVLCLNDTEYEPHTTNPELSNGLWVQYLIDNFASVKEAVKSLNTFQVVPTMIGGEKWALHACLEDVSGDSAIIEYIDGKMVLYYGPHHSVITNSPPYAVQIDHIQRYEGFGGKLALPCDELHSEERFVQCMALLKALPEPQNLEDALKSLYQLIIKVKVPADLPGDPKDNPSPTRWISISDMTHLKYYFESSHTSNILWIDFKHLDFSATQAIKHINPHDPKLCGEIWF